MLPAKPPKPSDVKSIPRPTASVLSISFAKIGSIPCVNGVIIIQIVDLENSINETGDWNDEIEKQFTEILESFKKTQTY